MRLTGEALATIQQQPKVSDFIFPYDPKSISTRFTRTMKVLGIEDLRLHDLRHECCSWLGELKHDIPLLPMCQDTETGICFEAHSHKALRGQI